MAASRSAALEAVTRRPIVRAALAIDRRVAPMASRSVARARRGRARAERSALVVVGLGRRRSAQAALAQVLAGARVPRSFGPTPPTMVVEVVDLAAGPALGVPQGPMVGHRVVDGGAADLVSQIDDALREASSGWFAVVRSTTEPADPDWLVHLTGWAASHRDAPVVAVAPLLVHPVRHALQATPHDGRVRAAGYDIDLDPHGVPRLTARLAGGPVPQTDAVEVAAVDSACVLVDRGAAIAAGGLSAGEDLDVAIVDLCVRMRATRGLVVVAPTVVVDHRPVSSRRALRWPMDPAGGPWRGVVERHGPTLWRDAAGARPGRRFVFTIAAPSAKVARRWGDWHLAQGMAGALRRLGHQAMVQTADAADSLVGRSHDVHVVVRGLRPVRRTPGQCHVLWVISHPESLADEELHDADLVLVASERFAQVLGARTETPVGVLLQATDAQRFHPHDPVPQHRHPVTIVAKSREHLRPMVAMAIEGGLSPAIYGGGWAPFVDPALIVADHVANEELPLVYSSAGVVLNDHWEAMRSAGFVSNRIFDVLACGTPVISDHLPEIVELFGDLVPTWEDQDQLVASVTRDLASPDVARVRAAAGRELVLAHHTFDHRAVELLDALARIERQRPSSQSSR